MSRNVSPLGGVRRSVLFAALLASGSALADVREEVTFSYTLESGGRLSLENVNGSISIDGGDGDQVVITAHKKANNQEALDEIEINIDATSTRISIDTDLPNSKGWWGGNNSGASVSYELSVPSNIDLDSISSVNGGIDISGVFGTVKAETVNGSIDVDDAAGDVKLETVNGSIDARFSSVTGDQRINCDTVNGKINLTLPANADASVSVETVNGSINASDFGLKVDKGFVGKSLDGDIGDGSARITANTVNGGVKLRAR
ncbi:MAG: DUF4097 family beta strand repeat-containing protein [Xanthomonadales bacterium]|jgi:DUF4097 and DUF4098 domain-containing protein YvlB|nr:DUF4097 family beta strand repeat-containing protein [Xanthomonadales bacterium]